jgi:hypothetical protein
MCWLEAGIELKHVTQVKQRIPKVCADAVQFICRSHTLIKLSSERCSYKMDVAVTFMTLRKQILKSRG